jgi:hypothetical protein
VIRGCSLKLCDRRGTKEKRNPRRDDIKGLGIYLATICQSRYIEEEYSRQHTEDSMRTDGMMECWKNGMLENKKKQKGRRRIQGNHESTKIGKHEKRLGGL